jgi:hypothetical protein
MYLAPGKIHRYKLDYTILLVNFVDVLRMIWSDVGQQDLILLHHGKTGTRL